jgi:cell wall assembly regulator SMI1
VPVPWPDGGPWALATTSATVDGQPAAAALAAASTVRVAALTFGAQERPGELLLAELATFLQVGDGAADPLSVDEAAALVRTLARTHGLVLVVGVPGLLVPVGRAGWTLMDLAVAVSAPVVVITGTGPDAANHTTLALGAVAAHGLAATVITVGGPAAPAGSMVSDGSPAPADLTAPAGSVAPEGSAAPAGLAAGANPASIADSVTTAGSGTSAGPAASADPAPPAGTPTPVAAPSVDESEGPAVAAEAGPAVEAGRAEAVVPVGDAGDLAPPAGTPSPDGAVLSGADPDSPAVAAEAGPAVDSGQAEAAARVDDTGQPEAAPADGPARAADDFEAAIPVAPAGRIPGDAADRPGEFAAAAKGWLDPVLHASAGRSKAGTPLLRPPPLPPPATTSGKRVVLLLAGVFVSMSLVVCGLAFCQPTSTTETTFSLDQVEVDPAPPVSARDSFVTPQPQPPPQPRPAVTEVCPQNQGRITPTEPSRATTKRVDAAWKRIEVWLAAHAPASRRSLRAPAARKRIDAAQRRMSVAFPADLVASLRRHDGVTTGESAFSLPFFYDPAPVAEIVSTWQSLCSVVSDVFGEDGSDWWDKGFVPFASSLDGGNLLVDVRPGHHGRVGEFFNEDGVSFERWPASLTELLEKTATSLETGRPFDGNYRPEVTKAGGIEWDIQR